MSLRLLLVILLTVLLIIFFINNDQVMEINLWVSTFRVSKALLLPALTLIGLILGYILGHYSPNNRKRKKELKEAHHQLETINRVSPNKPMGTLSEEDQKYLN